MVIWAVSLFSIAYQQPLVIGNELNIQLKLNKTLYSHDCKHALLCLVSRITVLPANTTLSSVLTICIGNSMICSDIWHKYHEWYFEILLLYVISRAVRQVKFETILKYYEWYLCQISRTNHAISCLYYYPQEVCNFHM